MQEGDVNHDYEQEIKRLAEWLSDPENAEPCDGFPGDADGTWKPGIYAWHGDEEVEDLLCDALGPVETSPLYLGRTSGPLNTRILRDHLHNTRSSTLRRSLAAMLWDELDLGRAGANTIDATSNARLTEWMLEHLEVSVVPVAEPSHTAVIEADVLRYLDPPLNLVKVPNSPGRTRLRALRRQHFAVTRDTGEGARQLLALHAAERINPGVVVPITLATGKGSRRSRATRQSFWTPADVRGGA
jgi:hypothetical protein